MYIWQFDISGSCWKKDSSRFTRTTNHSFTQWLKQQSYGHQDNRDTSPPSQNSPKEEFGYSSAELLYGESLTVPGDFNPPGFTNDPAQESPLKFRGNIPKNFPRPASSHSSTATFVPPSLMTAKYVYLLRHGTKGPLQRPYTGPYAALTPEDKTFLLDIGVIGRSPETSFLRSCTPSPGGQTTSTRPPPSEAETTFRWQLFTRTFCIAIK